MQLKLRNKQFVYGAGCVVIIDEGMSPLRLGEDVQLQVHNGGLHEGQVSLRIAQSKAILILD